MHIYLVIPLPMISDQTFTYFFQFLVLAKGGSNVKATITQFARKPPVHPLSEHMLILQSSLKEKSTLRKTESTLLAYLTW